MIYVLAHDFQQFSDWLKRKGLKYRLDAQYVFNSHGLRALNPQHDTLVELPNWQDSKSRTFIEEHRKWKQHETL